MRRYLKICLFVFTVLFITTACSNKLDPLVIASDAKRTDVKTEEDVFNDLMYRLNHYYFPTEVGKPEWLGIIYKVENEEIELKYEYDASKLSKEESVIPSLISLYVNNLEDQQRKKPGKNRVHFALDTMEGEIGKYYNETRYLGHDKENDDEFVYIFEGTDPEEFFESAIATGMRKSIYKDFVNGYDLIADFLETDIKEIDFLDVENTNFDIVEIRVWSDQNSKFDEDTNYAGLMVKYQYQDSYSISLTITKDPRYFQEWYREWRENGFKYSLSRKYESQEAREVDITEEQYEEFKSFLTRKVTDE